MFGKTAKCPKCKAEIARSVAICPSCGCDAAAKRRSRLTFVAVILMVAVSWPFGLLGFGLAAAFLFYARRMAMRTPPRRKLAAGLAVVSFVFLLLSVIMVFWRMDAPPIPNDYTVADLRSVPDDCKASRAILLSLADPNDTWEGCPTVGLTVEDVAAIRSLDKVVSSGKVDPLRKTVLSTAQAIHTAWENAKKGRNVIDALDEFPEIADPTLPSDLLAPISAADGLVQNHLAVPLSLIGTLYETQACLDFFTGNQNDAVQGLLRLDSVARKLFATSRSPFVSEPSCRIMLNDIRVAGYIARDPNASGTVLKRLVDHFKSFDAETASFDNLQLFEYLGFKESIEQVNRKYPQYRLHAFKVNSAYRLSRKLLLRQDHDLSVWPALWPLKTDVRLDAKGQLPLLYRLYNPLGAVLVWAHASADKHRDLMSKKLIVESEKLAKLLASRLAEKPTQENMVTSP